MKQIVSIDPFRCRMWELHDRLEQHIDESSCKAEIDSFLEHGQLVPVLGRSLRSDPMHDVELIYGARRLFVARHLNRPLLVEMRDIPDAEGIVAMDIENRHRRDISPYERGLSYLRWLRSGHFKSQDEIARALKVSASQISRLIKLAMLPAVVISAFHTPTDICETWAANLTAALDDPVRRPFTCSRARKIASLSSRLPAREVYRQLITASAPERIPRKRHHDEVVNGVNGKPLFRIRHHETVVALLVPLDCIGRVPLTRIRDAVSEALQHGHATDAERSGNLRKEEDSVPA